MLRFVSSVGFGYAWEVGVLWFSGPRKPIGVREGERNLAMGTSTSSLDIDSIPLANEIQRRNHRRRCSSSIPTSRVDYSFVEGRL